MQINYKQNLKLNVMQLQDFYALNEKQYSLSEVKQALDYSLFTISAFHGSKLVGYIRLVGDGYHMVLICDLLSHPDYDSNLIKKELIDRVLTHYHDVTQVMILSDDPFFVKLGFMEKHSVLIRPKERASS